LKVSISTDPIKDDLVEYVKAVELEADYIHCDVMDGKFVPKQNFSIEKMKQINAISTIPLDVHLMVENPMDYIPSYAEAGANIITIHYESFEDYKQIEKALELIKKYKCLAGISLNPDTFIDKIVPLLDKVDMVLIMSVVPGKSGQKFIDETYDKLKTLNKYKKYNNYKFLVEVDGGVNPEISKELAKHDVDMVVSGNYVYSSTDKKQAIDSLK